MSTLPAFQLLRPASVTDAVKLREKNPASRFIAGGTDLLPNIRRGLFSPEIVIDLGSIPELRELRQESGMLHIGAGVTLARIAADPLICKHLPALAEAAIAVAGPTHRTAATLGGNLCLDTRCKYYNQSEPWREGNHYCMKLVGDICRVAPKSKRCYAAFSGDIAPALMVLDARIEILGSDGSRHLPIADLYRDDGMAFLTLGPGELLTAINVPLDNAWLSAYEKVRIRGAIDFPLTGVAVAMRRDGDALGGLRISCTGVSSRPEQIDGLEGLIGRPVDATALATIAEQTDLANRSMKTTIADPLYRRNVAPILATRLVTRLWSSAAG